METVGRGQITTGSVDCFKVFFFFFPECIGKLFEVLRIAVQFIFFKM